MNIEKLNPCIKNLEDLSIMKSSSTTAYSEAIKEVSKECEVDAGLLRKLISTLIDDKKNEAMELSEDFITLLEGLTA